VKSAAKPFGGVSFLVLVELTFIYVALCVGEIPFICVALCAGNI